MSIATVSFSWYLFAWNIFFQLFTFSLYVYFGLRWVFCRQHIQGSCFCIHSATLCLLVGAFNPFTFKVIIEKYYPIAIYFVLWLEFINLSCVSCLEKIIFCCCWRAAFLVLNSLSFCLSVKLLMYPSYLNEIFAVYCNLGCRFFSFITFRMSCHSLLAWRVSIERSSVILMRNPLCVIFCFPLLLLIFAFWSLLIWLTCVLGYFTLSLSFFGLYGFLGLGWLFSSPF